MTVAIVRVAGPGGRIIERAWLERSETVHRQLRPQLPEDYAATMARIFAGGAEMVVAVLDEAVAGVAVFRLFQNTNSGLRFYVDDLVTDETRRSAGVGGALMAWLESEARARRCPGIELESGVQRVRAHRFYFREGFAIPSFSFRKTLS